MASRMKSEERRAAIVKAAIRLFAEKGFRGATTRELAACCGITEPVLYQHFRTKRDLYTAIIEAKAGEVSPRAATLAAAAQSDDDRRFFTTLGELILTRYRDDPELTRLLFFSALEGHELSDLFYERLYAGSYKLVAEHIKRRVREGRYRKTNADCAARGLIGMVSYDGLTALLFPARFKMTVPKRTARERVEVYLGGIQ